MNGSSGGSGSLANLTEQLLQASLELTFAGDVPEIVDLLGLAVDAVASGDNSVSPDSFGVSLPALKTNLSIFGFF